MPIDFNTAPIRPSRNRLSRLDFSSAPIQPGQSSPLFADDKQDSLYDFMDEILAQGASAAPASATAVAGARIESPEPAPATPDMETMRGGGIGAIAEAAGIPEEYDPSKSLVRQLPSLAVNTAVSGENLILGLLSLPLNAAMDPIGTAKSVAMYAPEQLMNLHNADLLNFGPGTDDPTAIAEWTAQRDVARGALFKDPAGPFFAGAMMKGAMKLVQRGPGFIREKLRQAKTETLKETAETVLGSESPFDWAAYVGEVKAKTLLLPPPRNLGEGFTVAPPPVKGRRIPQGGLIEEDFSVTAPASGQQYSGSFEPLPVVTGRGTAPPGNFMDFIGRLKAESKPGATVAPEPTRAGQVGDFRGRVGPGVKEPDFVPVSEMFWRKPDGTLPKWEDLDVKLQPIEDAMAKSPLSKEARPAIEPLPSEKWYRKWVTSIPRTVEAAGARDAVMARAAEMQIRQYKVGKWVHDSKKQFSKSERENMIFYAERTKNPYTKAEPELSNAAKKFVDEDLTVRNKTMFDELVDNGLLDDTKHIEDFLSHFWVRGGKNKAAFGRLVTKARQGRKIPTYADGIEFGLKPLRRDAVEIQAIYEDFHNRVIVNHELVGTLHNMLDGEGNPMVLPRTKKTAKLEAEGWQVVDNEALSKAVYVTRKGGKGKPVTLLRYPKTIVHPQIKTAVERVFANTWSPGWFNAVRFVNATAKQTQLGLSLFHPFALFETSLGMPPTEGSYFKPGFKSKSRFGLNLLDQPGFLEEAAHSGAVFGASPDIARGIVNSALLKMEAKASGVPVAAQASTFLRWFKETYDHALWDKYHNGLKAYAYYTAKMRLLEKFPNVPEKMIQRSAAEFSNDAVGGQNWDAMLLNPHVESILHATLLSPDWTYSNIKQGGHLLRSSKEGALRARFAGLPESLVQEVSTSSQLMGAMGRRYWARTAMYSFLGLQMSNLIFSTLNKKIGKPQFTWQNDPGNTLNVVSPFGPDEDAEDQRLTYIIPFKQIKELWRWMTRPHAELGAKLSPALRQGIEQASGHDAGSGFPAPWTTPDEYGIDKTFWGEIPARAQTALELYMPFSFSGNNFAFTLPTSKGMTNHRFVQMYRKAYLDGDEGQMSRLELSGVLNGLDVGPLRRSAISGVKRGLKANEE